MLPPDRALAFLCDLLEDLADEWAVKPLFLYRWWDPEDQAYVSRWAGQEWSTSEAATGSAEEIDEFRRRQISRMSILGATAENKPLLEESYRRILAAFEPHVGMTNYLFGSRPSLADFAWFGQLSEMATDPTPMRILRERAPFTDHWVRRLDDASGVDGEWHPRERVLNGWVEALLRIAGELYLPFLVANAEAFARGLERLEIEVWGLPYALGAVQISGEMPRISFAINSPRWMPATATRCNRFSRVPDAGNRSWRNSRRGAGSRSIIPASGGGCRARPQFLPGSGCARSACRCDRLPRTTRR